MTAAEPDELPLSAWEGVDAEGLAREWGCPRVHLFARLGSTSDVARRLAAEGAPSGTLVLAEEQTAGRGRLGRAWASRPGLGLWLSLLVRPAAGSTATALPLLVALTAAEALDPLVAPAVLGIKWPNDLQVDGLKVGGILCEGVWDRGGLATLVVGVGINVLHGAEDFPPELRETATSLSMAAGRPVSRARAAGALVSGLSAALSTPAALGAAALARFTARDVLRGRAVVVTEPSTGAVTARGRALGIDDEGGLRVRSPEGDIRSVRAGTVRAADAGQ